MKAPRYVNLQNSAMSLKTINFFHKTKLILYLQVTNPISLQTLMYTIDLQWCQSERPLKSKYHAKLTCDYWCPICKSDCHTKILFLDISELILLHKVLVEFLAKLFGKVSLVHLWKLQRQFWHSQSCLVDVLRQRKTLMVFHVDHTIKRSASS